MQSTHYVPLHRRWLAKDLFAKVQRRDVILSDEQLEQCRGYFMGHLQAESDSSNLYRELIQHHAMSGELGDFLRVWHIEEQNHAKGFYIILQLLYGDDESQLRSEIELKPANFDYLKNFFDDEFKLCVLFAFDEYATIMDYKKNTIYSQLGPQVFVDWGDKVIKDEARHFMNAIKLIHHKHQARIGETEAVLQHILQIEKDLSTYQHTFLFDHDEKFLLSYAELEKVCATRVMQSIFVK